MRWRDLDELVAWLGQLPPADAVRISRLLADTKTAGALRALADKVVYDMTREATYEEVAQRLGQSYKQVMKAAERERARMSA